MARLHRAPGGRRASGGRTVGRLNDEALDAAIDEAEREARADRPAPWTSVAIGVAAAVGVRLTARPESGWLEVIGWAVALGAGLHLLRLLAWRRKRRKPRWPHLPR